MAVVIVYRQRGLLKRWRWRRVAANGRRIAGPQQAYTRKSSAVRSAASNFPNDEIFDEYGRAI